METSTRSHFSISVTFFNSSFDVDFDIFPGTAATGVLKFAAVRIVSVYNISNVLFLHHSKRAGQEVAIVNRKEKLVLNELERG